MHLLCISYVAYSIVSAISCGCCSLFCGELCSHPSGLKKYGYCGTTFGFTACVPTGLAHGFGFGSSPGSIVTVEVYLINCSVYWRIRVVCGSSVCVRDGVWSRFHFENRERDVTRCGTNDVIKCNRMCMCSLMVYYHYC